MTGLPGQRDLMTEKRQHQRLRCSGEAHLESLEEGPQLRISGRLADLSLGGFYVTTAHAWAIGKRIRFRLTIQDIAIEGGGQIATSHGGVGMGIKITALVGADRVIFGALLHDLGAEENDELDPGYLR